MINGNKERVDFGQVIGQYIDPVTKEAVDTTTGIIHYGKKEQILYLLDHNNTRRRNLWMKCLK